METMQQIRNAHKKAETTLSLRAFAKQQGVEARVAQAHESANKTRSEAKKIRTRAATAARKAKKTSSGGKKDVTVVAAR